MPKSPVKQIGFTIVELLIVIVVIGILAAITIVAYNGIQQRARVAVLQSDLRNASNQLGTDNINNGTYPASTSAANGEQGLKASPGTTWQYTYTIASNSYCITGTNNGVSYFTSTANPTPQAGACPGHINGGVATLTCPSGFIVVPGSSTYGTSDFCTMKYEAKQVGSTTTPVSQAAGLPWTTISQTTAIANSPNVAGCTSCHLVTEAEWLTIMQNVLSVASNWSGGTVGTGYIYSGYSGGTYDSYGMTVDSLAADTNDANGYSGETNTGGNRRTLTLTNGEVIWDLAGNVGEWTTGTSTTNQPGGSGYAWREWNTVGGTGSLSPNPFPVFGTPAASGWTITQGIGRLFSNTGETAVRGFIRGGSWNFGDYPGVSQLLLYYAPSNTSAYIGFRVSQ